MKKTVHVANTDVEFEYAYPSGLPLENSWNRHSICLQLQFLPLLYAKPEDIIAVTVIPDKNYFDILQETGWWPAGFPQFIPLKAIEPFQGGQCISWGHSQKVKAWAEVRQMNYAIPKNWRVIRLVNSKAFSFRYSSLSEAALLSNENELSHWIRQVKGPKVLKTCFGVSGQGSRYISGSEFSSEILAFCHHEWQHKRSVVGEPWLDRVCDFSTQWLIHSDQRIEKIGVTRFETSTQGSYQGTLVGPEEKLFEMDTSFLEQHQDMARKALQDMANLGFFGYVGVDALLYRHPQTHVITLYPVVEINARQTMSLVALRLQQRLCPHQILYVEFKKKLGELSLLPQQLIDSKGKMKYFGRGLFVNFLSY